MNLDFINSMEVTVGQMDSKYGYSSEKLTQFFYEMFYIDPITRKLDDYGEVGDEQILSTITETLLLVDNYKQLVKLKYRGFFTRSELAFIFQYFNGSIIEYRDVNVFEQHTQFIEDFNEYGHDHFDNENERDEFINKVASMYPFEFFMLAEMIIEDWDKIPVIQGRKSLLDELSDNSSEKN